MTTYFFVNDGVDPDILYGTEKPVCIDRTELERLRREARYDDPENAIDIIELVHEASAEEIERYGVYDSAHPKMAELDAAQIRKLLGVDYERREDEPIGHVNYRFRDAAYALIDRFVAAAFVGVDPDDEEMIVWRARIYDLDDAKAVADVLITYETYTHVEVDYQIPEDYNGLDALVDMARIEFAHNILGGYASDEEFAACFER